MSREFAETLTTETLAVARAMIASVPHPTPEDQVMALREAMVEAFVRLEDKQEAQVWGVGIG